MKVASGERRRGVVSFVPTSHAQCLCIGRSATCTVPSQLGLTVQVVEVGSPLCNQPQQWEGPDFLPPVYHDSAVFFGSPVVYRCVILNGQFPPPPGLPTTKQMKIRTLDTWLQIFVNVMDKIIRHTRNGSLDRGSEIIPFCTGPCARCKVDGPAENALAPGQKTKLICAL